MFAQDLSVEIDKIPLEHAVFCTESILCMFGNRCITLEADDGSINHTLMMKLLFSYSFFSTAATVGMAA